MPSDLALVVASTFSLGAAVAVLATRYKMFDRLVEGKRKPGREIRTPRQPRASAASHVSEMSIVQGVEIRKSAIPPPPKAAFLRNYVSLKKLPSMVTAKPTAPNVIGLKPAWGKDTPALGKDVMWTSVRAGRASLDAFEPMERVALNASGTFQRTVSSYYNAPVYVETDYNTFPSRGKCSRQVTMSVGGYEFAVCTSYMEVMRPDLIDAVENKGVAIGQLFRHYEMMPVYALLAAGLDPDQPDAFIWRVYTLTVEGAVMCRIHEKIRRDVFDLQFDPDSDLNKGGAGTDVVKPNVTYMELPEGFSQLERILLTANANVERIIGSYYNMATIVHVMQNYRREPCVFERKTAMLMQGEEFMYATVTVFLADSKWEECMMNNSKAGLGQVFTMMGVQPTFKLRDAGRTPGSFWRTYTLSSKDVTVQITEVFNMYIFALDQSASHEYKFVYASDACSEASGHAARRPTTPTADDGEGSPVPEPDMVAAGNAWHSARVKLSAARALQFNPVLPDWSCKSSIPVV